ncbi:hypothetical protein, partial [Pseudomonas sp. R62]
VPIYPAEFGHHPLKDWGEESLTLEWQPAIRKIKGSKSPALINFRLPFQKVAARFVEFNKPTPLQQP